MTEIVEFPALKDAQGKLDARRKSLADILTEAGPDYDMSKVKSIAGDTAAKVAEIGKINAEIDDCKKKVDELLVVARAAAEASRHEEHAERGSEPGTVPERGSKGSRRSFADLLMDSVAVKEFRGSAGPSATLDIELKTLFETGQGGGAGWDPYDARTGRIEYMATRPAPHVVNVIPQTTTSFSTVKYMEETTLTNSAAEATEGAAYAESALALTERSSEVRKIATFLPVTDEVFEDEARARSYVENRLPFLLQQRLDSQILVGNGTAPNLRGTENVSGINTQALGGDPIPDAIYKAMRAIRDTGFAEPSHVFIRPSKWEAVRLLRTADGMYIWGNPSEAGPERIWGVPVIQTTAPTATKAVLGDYTNFAELAVRRGIDVQVSNSHSSYFVEGKLALRADVRVALIHYRPSAFAVVTGL
ncbi:phage major capsid protein [Streptomyces sp. NPDC012888]|uniref:phage major capsid protein n=1 Tax=Streptomyces sp. NPDC012888 TaxID=3364855 RepID=UPI0036853827